MARGGQRGAVDRNVKDGQRKVEKGDKRGVVGGRGGQEKWLEMVRQGRWQEEFRGLTGSGSQTLRYYQMGKRSQRGRTG